MLGELALVLECGGINAPYTLLVVPEKASNRRTGGVISFLALERDSRGLLVVLYIGALALAFERGGNGEGEEAVQGMLLD